MFLFVVNTKKLKDETPSKCVMICSGYFTMICLQDIETNDLQI